MTGGRKYPAGAGAATAKVWRCAAALVMLTGALAASEISLAGEAGEETAGDPADGASSQERGGRRGGEQNGREGRRSEGARRSREPGSRMLERASALKAAGQCSEAIPIYACFAGRGRGYEIAQLSLAECLVEEASGLKAGDQKAGLERQALFWADRAARFGDANAQGFLAYQYLAGNITSANAAEGTKWYYLFQQNPRYVKLGFGRLPEGTDALARKASTTLIEARARAEADAWRPVYDLPAAPPEMMPADGCQIGQRRGGEEGDEREAPPQGLRRRR